MSTLIHSNPFSKVFHTESDFGTFKKNYYVTYFGPRSGIVAVRGTHVLLVRQYRFLPDRLTLEIPGGTVEAHETPDQAILRECIEEAGVACRELHPLLEYYPGLDNVDNRTTVFFSENVEEVGTFRSDHAEVTEVVWVPIAECLEKIYKREITDALTIVGILAYEHLRANKSGDAT